ncbi:hypothetical protein V6Z11_A07G108500 [Gossypium hirsutum]
MGSFSSPLFYLLEASSKNEKTRVQPPFQTQPRRTEGKAPITRQQAGPGVEVVENEGRETWAKTWSGVYGDPVWSAEVGVEFVVC